MTRLHLAVCAAALLAACSDVEGDDHDHHHDHNHGVTTTVELTFVAQSDGSERVFSWDDPEADGAPTIDEITLAEGEAYALSVAFLNKLEEPEEDVTAEVAAEGTTHQVFVTGDAVDGPAAGDNPDALVEQAYADADANGAPLGLEHDVVVVAAGEGDLTLTLRHLPPEGGAATKTADLAEQVAAGGFSSIPGDNDVQVDFPLTVD